MKARIYLRFSPRRNSDESDADEKQLAHCQAWLKENAIECAGVYVDRAVSGKSPDDFETLEDLTERKDLLRLLADLRKGEIVLSYDQKRIARDPFLGFFIARQVMKKKCRLATTVEGILNMKDDAHIFLWFSRWWFAGIERKDNNRRTSRRMLQHQLNGRRMSHESRVPYGKQIDPSDSTKLVNNPREQKVITLIKRLSARGKSARKIAAALDKRGIKPRLTKRWSHMTVVKILKRVGAATVKAQ